MLLSSTSDTLIPRMEVRMIKGIKAGEVVDLPLHYAKYLIIIGQAEEPTQRPVTVQRIRKAETR